MIRRYQICAVIIVVLGLLASPVFCAGGVRTKIKVILASTGPSHVDPGLEPIISEMESVFKYTRYSLLQANEMNLGLGASQTVSLPGGRTLVISPQSMEKDRINYQILIQKGGSITFKTRVLLKNNSSITIGGPKYENGTLLFNIAGSAS